MCISNIQADNHNYIRHHSWYISFHLDVLETNNSRLFIVTVYLTPHLQEMHRTTAKVYPQPCNILPCMSTVLWYPCLYITLSIHKLTKQLYPIARVLSSSNAMFTLCTSSNASTFIHCLWLHVWVCLRDHKWCESPDIATE